MFNAAFIRCRGVYLRHRSQKIKRLHKIKTINQTNFKFMEKKILYHIGLYGFRKLIVYVIKDNGDNTSIVSLNKDGSFPKHVWNCNLHNINE